MHTSRRKKKGSNPSNIRRISLTSDTHFPQVDHAAWKTHLAVVRDFKPHTHIIVGDFGEFESMSQHPKSNLDARRLGQDFAACNQGLDQLDAVLPPGCEKWFLEGNHEYRLKRWIANRSPELAGGVKSVEEGLHLARRGWKWLPYGKLLKLGKANFTHGRFTNKYHSEKHVSSYGDSVIYGDTHTHQVFTKTHGKKPHVGMSIGCLRTLDPEWLNDAPVGWVHGFAVVHLYPNGNFIPQFVPILNGRTVFNGKAY